MANITLRFLDINGTCTATLEIPRRADGAISFADLTDLMYAKGYDAQVRALEAGQYRRSDNQDVRDGRYQGRVEFRSTVQPGAGTGAMVACKLQSQGFGAADVNVPSGSTVAYAFAQANLALPQNATLLLNGNVVTKESTIPANATVQISATGAVKGGC